MSDAPRTRNTASGPDFLQRVVDRAFEQADALAPRLPSRFEPLGPAVVWPAEVEREHMEAQQPPADGIADPVASVAEGRDASFSVPISRQSDAAASNPDGELNWRVPADTNGGEPSAAVAEGQPQREAGRVQPSARVSAAAPRAERGPALHAPIGRLYVAPPERLSRPITDPSGGPMPAQQMRPSAPTVRALLVAQTAPGNESAPPSNARAARSNDPFDALEPALRRIAIEAPAVRQRLEREPTATVRAPSGAEPVVNVTIGRVEIRAVAAQSGPLPQAPRTPKPLSLDDYLKQRGGGR